MPGRRLSEPAGETSGENSCGGRRASRGLCANTQALPDGGAGSVSSACLEKSTVASDTEEHK